MTSSIAFGVENRLRVLAGGKRETVNIVIRKVNYDYYAGWDDGGSVRYYPGDGISSGTRYIVGTEASAYTDAGDTDYAISFFISNGFQYCTDLYIFERDFERHRPDRWDNL